MLRRAVGEELVSTTDERDDGSIETARLETAPQAEPADGDDIVVIPAGPEDPERQRRRRAIHALGGVAVAVLVVGAIALVARNNDPATATVRLSPPTTVATEVDLRRPIPKQRRPSRSRR